jgi:MCP family monocarboxylic acid transporter-like MFS transporter 14
MRQMLDMSLLRDAVFLMFATSNFLTSVGFNVPYVYTVDRAEMLGVDKERASFLLSVIGMANTIGRIVLGYLSDKGWVNRLWLYNFALAVCGLCELYKAS